MSTLSRIALCITIGGITLAKASLLMAHGGHHHGCSHDEHAAATEHTFQGDATAEADEHFIPLSAEQIKTAQVDIATASAGYLVRQIRAPAKVILPAQHLIHVVPQVAGTVAATYKQVGDTVAAGEILALIDSRESAQAKAAYFAALKRMTVKDSIYAREQKMRERKLSTDQEYWQAHVEAAETMIDYELAKQQLLALGMTAESIEAMASNDLEHFRRYELRAPQAGTVVEQNIAPGAYLNSDRAAYLLADLSQRWLEIDLPVAHQRLVDKGASVHITAADGATFTATIACCKPVIEEKTRTLKVYATFDGQEIWHAGTFITATIDAKTTHHPLVIPKSAVQTVHGQTVVFVRQAHGFEIRPVTLGEHDDEQVAILTGLQRGESYAVRNTFLLKAEHEKDEAEHEH